MRRVGRPSRVYFVGHSALSARLPLAQDPLPEFASRVAIARPTLNRIHRKHVIYFRWQFSVCQWLYGHHTATTAISWNHVRRFWLVLCCVALLL